MKYIIDECGNKIKLKQCSKCKRSIAEVPTNHLSNVKCPNGVEWICQDCKG